MDKLDIFSKDVNSPMEKAQSLVELEIIVKKAKEKIEAYKKDLLEITKQLDVFTLKTGNYTITRTKRITPKITNFENLKKSLEQNSIPYETQEVFADFMKETFKQAIKEKKELDGLDALETECISVRTKDKGGGNNV